MGENNGKQFGRGREPSFFQMFLVSVQCLTRHSGDLSIHSQSINGSPRFIWNNHSENDDFSLLETFISHKISGNFFLSPLTSSQLCSARNAVWTISRLACNCISAEGHCCKVHMTGYKAVRRDTQELCVVSCKWLNWTCKSIICHADNITDGISPLALLFNFTETFAGDS